MYKLTICSLFQEYTINTRQRVDTPFSVTPIVFPTAHIRSQTQPVAPSRVRRYPGHQGIGRSMCVAEAVQT